MNEDVLNLVTYIDQLVAICWDLPTLASPETCLFPWKHECAVEFVEFLGG